MSLLPHTISGGGGGKGSGSGNPKHAAHPLRILTWTLKSLFIYHLFHTYFYSLETGSGPSMLPTISVSNDWFLISRAYRRGRDVQVGDIVSFESVVEPGQKAFKRVLGLEGDCVMMGTPGSGETQMIRIPEGHCWVVGDNLEWSRDSRMFGPIPMALIKGKIIARVLPWSERKWFENDLKPVVDDC
ncbi:putative mitochondrial inner membrane protease subunit protein [Botrytis cinerea BcDW1]|uniref:Putative mitochondrial inner membrane protease subunit protein n=1 Tax=Botryotinia fuckeliana (strain BcDW1) TaxID=1290391 RepID=M7U3M6_BOTF1|nr:putative mitochondrial inner membrane protease subunit protein [Botrytis cinerea BcDW1]